MRDRWKFALRRWSVSTTAKFWGRKWKHVIEPRAIYRYVTGVDNFARILRFDERDILSNTSEVEYAVVNRLYAKRTSDKAEDCDANGMSISDRSAVPRRRAAFRGSGLWSAVKSLRQPEPQVREVITWELAQKYFLDPTFGGALVPGQRNVFTTTADFTGIAFLNEARRLSPLISRLKFQATSRTEAEWDIDYDFKHEPDQCQHGIRELSLRPLHHRRRGCLSAGAQRHVRRQRHSRPSISSACCSATDSPTSADSAAPPTWALTPISAFLQYAAVQTAYNWDCCGLSVEYRRFALGSVRNENQFRFNFALANIGSFGNLRRQEKLF